jgi:hypothetical protein
VTMDPARRAELVAQYRDGVGVVREALEGVTDDELDRRAGADEWTVREIVHHLADSEMTSAIRLRKLLVEDDPVIQGYDEPAYARRLTMDRPLDAALDAFDAARRSTLEIVERMTDADWQRAGTHTQSGRYSAETWLEIYAAHGHEHADQIARARSASLD